MAKAKTTETSLATQESNAAFLALANPNAASILAENIGDGQISPQDLEKVTIPTGGQVAWVVPTLEGEPDYVKSFEAVILYHKTGRVYWSKSLEEGGGNTPPDCHSEDGKTGCGKPGGVCSLCPFNQFGSSSKGQGKACKEQRLLFVFRPTDNIPTIVSLPPSSLQICRKFMIRLANSNKQYWSIVVKFELESTSNKSGIKYARLKISKVRDLTDEELSAFKSMRDTFMPALKQVSVASVAQDSPADGLDLNDAPDFNQQ
jgi:hypothetical protein